MNGLIGFDHWMYWQINTGMQNSVLDKCMAWTDKEVLLFIPLAIGLGLLSVLEKRRGQVSVLLLLVAGAITFLLGSQVAKKAIARERPPWRLGVIEVGQPNTPEHPRAHLLGPMRPYDNWSFPSNHTGVFFAMALVVALRHPWGWKIASYLAALFVGYSRVYVGLHFPLDVAGGILFGTMSGLLVYFAGGPLIKKYLEPEPAPGAPPPYRR